MKNKVVPLVVGFVLLLCADALLLFRYASWGLSPFSLVGYALFLLAAEALFFWSIWKFRTLINPFALYSFFIYTAGFSFFRLADKQQDYTLVFILLLAVSILCFVAGGLAATFTFRFSLQNFFPRLAPRLCFLLLSGLFIAGILVFVMEIRQLGYLPLLNLGNMSVYADLNENQVTPLHNFVVLNAVLPAMFYIQYREKRIPFYIFLALSVVSCFILINFFSRQMIVLLFFSMLLAVNYYRKIAVFKLLAIAVICVTGFIVLGELRDSSSDDASATSINEVIKGYTGIKEPTNLLETYLSLYGAVNFSTAQKLIVQSAEEGYYSFGAHTFRPVITLLPADKAALYPQNFSAYDQLGTYLVDPYQDFRWVGVIVLNFLYGVFSVNSFKNYLAKKSPYYIVEWALFMFCIFMCAFTNFFHMFFVAFFFLINRLCIK